MKFRTFLVHINSRAKAFTSRLFLVGAYVVGVGLTSIVSKLMGKQFLNSNPQRSAWKAYPRKWDWEKMY